MVRAGGAGQTGKPVKLTELSSAGGCGAKIGAGDLQGILAGISRQTDHRLLVGMDPGDDAAVYRLNDDTALVQTLDFFTPIVDDPYLFGQIAAANALSDIYAMGARPLLAMNIFAFPCGLGLEVLRAVLAGGANKVEEAGALLVGGHSLEDKEPKYGLSVSGLVHPDRIVSNGTARAGDALVLTKPLGIGILTSALRAGVVSEVDIEAALNEACRLNAAAAAAMSAVGVSAATDVTGFGLVGHLMKMTEASAVSAKLNVSAIPVWPAALELARAHRPGGSLRNEEFFGPRVELASAEARELEAILYDPQTSGGLLIALGPEKVSVLADELEAVGVAGAVIGSIEAMDPGEESARVGVKRLVVE